MSRFILIIGSLFVQLMFTVGFIILYGMYISFCNKLFYEACGRAAFPIIRFTGYVGTPIHELSHAIMCLLFGHTITKIVLVNGRKNSKTLGCVDHTYYKRNLYHLIGNFFIGVAPTIIGGMTIVGLLWLLTPSVFSSIITETAAARAAFHGGFSEEFIGVLGVTLKNVFFGLFSLENTKDARFWICIVLIIMIALHMEISRSDIRTSLIGLGVMTCFLVATDVLLGLLFPTALSAFTSWSVTLGVGIALSLFVPALFSTLIGVFSIVILLIRAIFGRGRKKPKARRA